MIKKLIVSHGQVAAHLVHAARRINAEPLGDIRVLCLEWDISLDKARRQVEDVLRELGREEGVLILTDVFGATPSNACAPFLEHGVVEMVTGVNLPMVMRLGTRQSQPNHGDRARGLDPGQGGQEHRPPGRSARGLPAAGEPGEAGGGRAARRQAVIEVAAPIVNRLGLHARAAAKLVHLASTFESDVHLDLERRGGRRQEHPRRAAAGGGAGHDGHRALLRARRAGGDGSAIPRLIAIASGKRVEAKRPASAMRVLEGLGVSRGVAIGRAVTVADPGDHVLRFHLDEHQIDAEIQRFELARRSAIAELEKAQHKMGETLGEDTAGILEAQALLLADPVFVGRIVETIVERQVNAEWAVLRTTEEYERRFAEVESEYLRERGEDLRNVANYLLRSLSGHRPPRAVRDPGRRRHHRPRADADRRGALRARERGRLRARSRRRDHAHHHHRARPQPADRGQARRPARAHHRSRPGHRRRRAGEADPPPDPRGDGALRGAPRRRSSAARRALVEAGTLRAAHGRRRRGRALGQPRAAGGGRGRAALRRPAASASTAASSSSSRRARRSPPRRSTTSCSRGCSRRWRRSR